jgi:hypothetical protein
VSLNPLRLGLFDNNGVLPEAALEIGKQSDVIEDGNAALKVSGGGLWYM